MLAKLANYNAPCVILGKQRLWWVFLLSSIVTPFVLAAIVLLVRFCKWQSYKRKYNAMAEMNVHLDREKRYGPKVTSMNLGEWWRWFKNMQIGEESPIFELIRNAADRIVSPRYRMGQVMMTIGFILSMLSMCIYWASVSYHIDDVEWCQPFVNNTAQQVDFAFNIFFLIYFLLRFLASDEKIVEVFYLYSIVDYFTVGPAFVGMSLNRTWVGLKFLRIIWLRRLSTILASFNIVTSSAYLKLLQLGCTLIAILLASGGFFHLLDNAGDFFYSDWDGSRTTYWDYSYFAFTTMSTIGGATINPVSVLAKLNNVLLVFITLALICFAVPDVQELLGNRKKYSGEYRAVHEERHILVCGDVGYESVVQLFMELFHPDRNVQDIKIVCLGPGEPDLDYDRFLKRNPWRIQYLRGSMIVGHDLNRAKLLRADACMILADKSSPDPDAEDSNNIMCVVAAKNHHPQLRVIVQLLQYRSKTYLTSIPNWSPSVGDDVICLPEIKLGLLAQSCYAPGFSTLIANLSAARSGDAGKESPEYMENYLLGAGLEMYTERMSNSFIGMTFAEAVEICYRRLDLLLVAVSAEVTPENTGLAQAVVLNPPTSFVIKTGTSGCFIADSAQDVQKALFFCASCHADVESAEFIQPCECEHLKIDEEGRCRMQPRSTVEGEKVESVGKKRAKTSSKTSGSPEFLKRKKGRTKSLFPAAVNGPVPNRETSSNTPDLHDLGQTPMGEISYVDDEDSDSTAEQEEEKASREKEFHTFEEKIVYYMRNYGSLDNWQRREHSEQEILDQDGRVLDFSREPRYDSTGMFWWCPPRSFSSILINRFEAAQKDFKNHVVVVVFADEHSTLLGLNNLVMPLRCSSTSYEDLADIVVLGEPKFLVHEWPALMNFPKIHVIKVFGLSRADLRAVNIHQCRQCLLLSSGGQLQEDSLLSDIDPVLSSLTIKAMNFGTDDDLNDETPITTAGDADAKNRPLVNTVTLQRIQNGSIRKRQQAGNKHHLSATATTKPDQVIHGYSIPMITELFHNSNVQFVDQEDEDVSDFYMAEPFLCGVAFTTSVLQSLMVSTYFNPYTLSVLRSMIFGGMTSELEQILAEGAGLIGGAGLSQKQPHPDRCWVDQISMHDSRISKHSTGTYGSMFLDAIRHHGLLCLGLYRMLVPEGTGPRSAKRYVITNPPPDFLVRMDDKVFAIERMRVIE